MRKNYFFLFILAVLPLTLCAERVTREQALKTATGFMSDKTFTAAKIYRRVRGTSSKDEPFYVFNASEGGFVIVSGDDRTSEILGYSSTGTLDLDSLPANLQWWLDEYARQIEGLGTTTVAKKTSQKASTASAISPLIQTKWNQRKPYNLMCPDGNGKDYYESEYNADNRCLTGCVATAMAQVMNYWQWPESCPELPAYTTSSNKYAIKALPSTTFKWDLMKNNYGYDETGDAANAVAELMRYCGQAVEMNYTPSASGAAVWREVMVETFGYSQSISDMSRDAYDLDTWENIIYKELAEGRPVLYSGHSENGGHEFIVDGYASNGLFHINWGWGGSCDNYFVLSVADPYNPGTAGASSSGGYRYYQDAMIGVKPLGKHKINRPYVVLSDDSLTVTFYYDSLMINRNGMAINSGNYKTATTAVFDNSFANYHPYFTENWFSGCYKLKEIKGVSNLNIDKAIDMSGMFENCSSLTSLDLSGFNTSNVTNMGYMFWNCSNLETIYAGDGWSTENVTLGNYMFSYCNKLTGGQGTEYNSGHTDYTYARIDGGTDAPGYFCSPGQMPPHAYAVLGNDGKTVTFYYDSQKESRGGIDINKTYTSTSPYGNATTAVIDASFANYRPASTAYWFSECSLLTSITGLENLNTSNVTSMSSMFRGCSKLTSLDLGGFNTSNVTHMGYMFLGCSGLTSLDISSFKTSNVTNMGYMFWNCSNLETIYAGDGWSTENVTLGNYMFTACYKLTGGQGTEYNSGHTDYTYARIDGGTDAPGYFTEKYILGDANGSGEVEIGDITSVLSLMANPDATGYNNKAADANQNGEIEIGDITTILTIMANGE